jgi:inosine-uridine nucleoside N-ribohydrolase
MDDAQTQGNCMKTFFRILFCTSLLAAASPAVAQSEASIPIIFDTDFGMPPTDDGLALMLALQSPEFDILGITTVAGNDSLEQGTADVLRMLEVAERTEIPVYRGADMPLVHAKSEYAVSHYGKWYSNEAPVAPSGGFATKTVEDESAVSFIVRAVMSRPKEVTLVAIGPLTNIAQAIKAEPMFAENVKQLVIMGGAIALLPDGAGNITPNAEYNFWVDPEAAYVTLRSGIPIELSPLNVSRKSALTKDWYEKMVAIKTPLTQLLVDSMGPRFEAEPDQSWFMYDQIAVASLIDPSLVTTEKLYVDVNIEHGISYGVSVGGRDVWPGAEGAQQINVQYDLDWTRFIEMFVERVQSPLQNRTARSGNAGKAEIPINPSLLRVPYAAKHDDLVISRSDYREKLYGFWLGQSIANWTGLVTELDKIGGEGRHGEFYTRDSWGQRDSGAIWSEEDVPSELSDTIDWVVEEESGIWGADDDTDIEYMYQELLLAHAASVLTAKQIRDGWLEHIYSDADTPFINSRGEKENYLWVSNQRAYDLMLDDGLLPPATSDPRNNPDYDMIDAQLTTEIFGLFAPARPDIALRMAYLPIRTTAQENAAWAAEFYVVMYSLASRVDQNLTMKEQIKWMADSARLYLPDESYTAKMYDFVMTRYEEGVPWEQARDDIYRRYQIEQKDGYDITARNLYCNGCFASGINFAASIISLLYGEGDYMNTVKIAVLAGWDSDNPAATWGGLLGFMGGKNTIEKAFGRPFADSFNIHRTRRNFSNDGIDSFWAMAEKGVLVVDRVVQEEAGGGIDPENDQWYVPVGK